MVAGIGSLSGAQGATSSTLTDAGELSRGTIANGDYWTAKPQVSFPSIFLFEFVQFPQNSGQILLWL